MVRCLVAAAWFALLIGLPNFAVARDDVASGAEATVAQQSGKESADEEAETDDAANDESAEEGSAEDDSSTKKDDAAPVKSDAKDVAETKESAKSAAAKEKDDQSDAKDADKAVKSSEKSSDADEKKPAEEKSAKKAKAEDKKPETHQVETKDLKIEVEVDGVFVAEDTEEVALRPEVWSSFKVVEAVPHGKRVRKGDVLVKFDDTDIEEAIAEKTLQMQLGEVALMAAEEEFPRLQKSIDLAYEIAERDRDEAADEYERFEKTMRSMSEKLADYYLQSAAQDLDNAREELDQLQKMYEADELTEETEEIVLRRQEFMVKQAEFFMEYSKINHDYTMNVAIPRREQLLTDAVEGSKLSYERAKMAKSLGLNKERYELDALREGRARSVEKHAKLLADRGLMTLKAPADGIVYYGRAVSGRWIEVSSMEGKLIPYGTVTPNSVVMTVVKDRPMYVETNIGEKDLPTVEAGQSVTIVPASDDDVELAGSVEQVADVPGGGNKFPVKVVMKGEKAPDWLMPGMTAKARIETYSVEDAVVIPADLVQSDEENPKKKYVMVQLEDEDEPVRREIKLGKSKDKNVEVLKGLKAGDLVVKGAEDKPGDDAKTSDEKKDDEKK